MNFENTTFEIDDKKVINNNDTQILKQNIYKKIENI